jgi:hypothetical protein
MCKKSSPKLAEILKVPSLLPSLPLTPIQGMRYKITHYRHSSSWRTKQRIWLEGYAVTSFTEYSSHYIRTPFSTQPFPINFIDFQHITLLKELETLSTHNSLAGALVKLSALLDRLNQNFQFVDPLDLLNCTPNEMGYPQVMGGSLAQLVDRLTHHNIYGMYRRELVDLKE